MSSSVFDWSVSLPERSHGSIGGYKPRATLLISSSKGDETLSIPVSVARALERFQDSEYDQPSSRKELLELLNKTSYNCAMERLRRLIDKRDYTASEAQKKLKLDGYTKDCIDKALARAQEVHLIDNERFAEVYIRTKIYSGWGMTRIEQELARKGIDINTVSGWPEEFLDPTEEGSRAYLLLEHKRIPEKNAFPKLIRFLTSRGFSYSVAQSAVRKRLAEEEARSEGA